ncbi:MAG: peroxiredoxin [Opitutaceae bacterium]|nr:peroxiredoxin [Opitutaceae bacterium]
MKLMRLFAALLGLFGSASLRADPLAIGSPAPAVSALDQNGKSVALGDLYAKGLVLVYFYPKADTPGCTKQACSLRDAYEALIERGVTIVGVSSDSVAAQKAFEQKHKLPFILLADDDNKVINAFGVPSTMGFASRQAYLIKDGVLVWRDLKASTEQQAADVLAALDAMAKPAG